MSTKLHGSRSHIQSISDPALLQTYANFGKTEAQGCISCADKVSQRSTLSTLRCFPAAANTPSARAATAVRERRGRVVNAASQSEGAVCNSRSDKCYAGWFVVILPSPTSQKPQQQVCHLSRHHSFLLRPFQFITQLSPYRSMLRSLRY